jgi:hypothetical protein
MTYDDQVAIGASLNEAVERVLTGFGIPELYGPTWTQLISAIAQSVLVKLDESGYQIVKK